MTTAGRSRVRAAACSPWRPACCSCSPPRRDMSASAPSTPSSTTPSTPAAVGPGGARARHRRGHLRAARAVAGAARQARDRRAGAERRLRARLADHEPARRRPDLTAVGHGVGAAQRAVRARLRPAHRRRPALGSGQRPGRADSREDGSAWRAFGGLALWVLRLIFDVPGTVAGFRRWVLAAAPVAPGIRAELTGSQRASAARRHDSGQRQSGRTRRPPASSARASRATAEPGASGADSAHRRLAPGEKKREALIRLYEQCGQTGDPRYGDRAKAAALAGEIAGRIGYHPGTARRELAKYLATQPERRSPALSPNPDPTQRRWPDAAPSPASTRLEAAHRARRAAGPRRRGPDRHRQPRRGPPPGPDPALADPAVPAARPRLRQHPGTGGALVPAAGGQHRPPVPAVAALVGAADPARDLLRGPAGPGALRPPRHRQHGRPDAGPGRPADRQVRLAGRPDHRPPRRGHDHHHPHRPATRTPPRCAARHGALHVFNPEGIGGLPSTFRWNPLQGCEQPAVALQRAAVVHRRHRIQGPARHGVLDREGLVGAGQPAARGGAGRPHHDRGVPVGARHRRRRCPSRSWPPTPAPPTAGSARSARSASPAGPPTRSA